MRFEKSYTREFYELQGGEVFGPTAVIEISKDVYLDPSRRYLVLRINLRKVQLALLPRGDIPEHITVNPDDPEQVISADLRGTEDWLYTVVTVVGRLERERVILPFAG